MAQLFAVDVVALGEVKRDDAVVVTGEHLLVLAGQKVEGETEVGVLVTPDDRQLELDQFGDQPSFGLLRVGKRGKGNAAVVRPGPGYDLAVRRCWPG